MEEIKDFKDAWQGDLVDYKGKTYRVISADFIKSGHVKKLRVVNPYPLFPLAIIKSIYR